MRRSLDGISSQPVSVLFYPIKSRYRWGVAMVFVGLMLVAVALWRTVSFQIDNQRLVFPSVAQNTPLKADSRADQLFSPYFYESSAPALADPVRLSIPSQQVAGEIVPVGLTSRGAIASPDKSERVGWYSLGARLGHAGTIALVGHKDDVWFRPAVFAYLNELSGGDEISLTDDLGRVWEYSVETVATYPAENLPLQDIFQNDGGQARVVLISCTGRWSWFKGSYPERVVVSAVAE